MPAVSVIIPAYNQGQFVGQAIQSVLDQTFADFEAVVVDDGSTDDTATVIQAFRDPRVRYVFQENRGLSAARNTGIRCATGDFLSYLDSDDLFLAKKLELLVSALQAAPEIGVIAGQAVPIDEGGQRAGRVFDIAFPQELEQLVLGNPLHVGSVLVRRSWQSRVGLFDEALRSYEDWDMWLRMALAGCRMTSVAEPVSLYRFHGEQMTRQQSQMTEATFAVLDKVYSSHDLPESWRELKDAAYAQAHMRGAAQAYRTRDFEAAKNHLSQAVMRCPDLTANDCEPLANQFSGWTELPKVGSTLDFLERIYDNLPPELEALRQRRNRDLGEFAMRQAFEAHGQNDVRLTREACVRAFRYQPRWLTNRGALSIFVRATLGGGATAPQADSPANP